MDRTVVANLNSWLIVFTNLVLFPVTVFPKLHGAPHQLHLSSASPYNSKAYIHNCFSQIIAHIWQFIFQVHIIQTVFVGSCYHPFISFFCCWSQNPSGPQPVVSCQCWAKHSNADIRSPTWQPWVSFFIPQFWWSWIFCLPVLLPQRHSRA